MSHSKLFAPAGLSGSPKRRGAPRMVGSHAWMEGEQRGLARGQHPVHASTVADLHEHLDHRIERPRADLSAERGAPVTCNAADRFAGDGEIHLQCSAVPA